MKYKKAFRRVSCVIAVETLFLQKNFYLLSKSTCGMKETVVKCLRLCAHAFCGVSVEMPMAVNEWNERGAHQTRISRQVRREAN